MHVNSIILFIADVEWNLRYEIGRWEKIFENSIMIC